MSVDLAQFAGGDTDVVKFGTFNVPRRFIATADPNDAGLPQCEFTVELDDHRRPRCIELVCRRRDGGRPVTGHALRKLPIGAYVRSALSIVATTAREGELSQHAFASPALLDALDHELASRARRGQRVPDEVLRRAAELYLDAPATGVGDRLDVLKDALHVSRSTAARYVRRARELGHLPPKERNDQ
ncbi:MAG: hypothetical protein QOJ97_110 [Solirubrobacteraceae bacterium]|nr:hypothetical protein [Solirubrobacteraceae bacterium]